MNRLCWRCLRVFEDMGEWAADRAFCPVCIEDMAHPRPESEDSYRERMADHESHAAEDEEARQRAHGMLDGRGHMWWGDGRLMELAQRHYRRGF